ELRIRPTSEQRVGGFEWNHRGRRRRDERNGKDGTGLRWVTERHLNLPATAAGFSIDETDSVRAILSQPVFRMADQQQLGKDQKAYRTEVPAVVVSIERAISIVESCADHLLHVHHRDASAPTMLEEFGVVHRAMMVDDVRRPDVLTKNDVRRITDRGAIEAIRVNLGSAYDSIRRVVVPRLQRRIEVNRIDPRISSSGGQNERLCGERNVGG